ncbi:MAG: thioredoxin [Lachnospiraceae bacterium]|nr:thioredoxin [Lachnospiraceae bacterium]
MKAPDKKRIILMITLTAAIILIFAGLVEGQASAVFEKAAKICMECIGIG